MSNSPTQETGSVLESPRTRWGRRPVRLLLGVAVAGFFITASMPTIASAAEKLTRVIVDNTTDNPVPVRSVGTTPVAGRVEVGNLPAVQTVQGAVDIANLPAVQNVAGTVAIDPANNTVRIEGTDAPKPWQTIIRVSVDADSGGGCKDAGNALGTDPIVLERVNITTSASDPGGVSTVVHGHYDGRTLGGSDFEHATLAEATSDASHFASRETRAFVLRRDDAPTSAFLNLIVCVRRPPTGTMPALTHTVVLTGHTA